MPVRPTLLHRMALVSFLLFRKNLGNLREFFGQMVYRPPWQKIARTPMDGMNPKPNKKLSLGAGSYVTIAWKGFSHSPKFFCPLL